MPASSRTSPSSFCASWRRWMSRSARSVSACELTDTYSPAAIERAPAASPATPARSTSLRVARPAATPITRLAVDTMPSLAPRTAARSHPILCERCSSRSMQQSYMAPTLTRFRSILCPVDFSKQSADALRCAVAIRGGGRVTVLTVIDPLLLAAAGAVYHTRRDFLRRTRVELEEFVSRSVGADGRHVHRVVGQGDAADAILKAAKRLKSDLIVMGTHGMTGVERLFVGSTTEQVLRRVTIPVLAVPRAHPSAGGRRLADQPVARLIAPMVPPPAGRVPNARAGGSMARVRAIAAGLRDKVAVALMERDRMQIAAMDAVMRRGRARPAGGPKRSPRPGAARRRT